MPEDRTSGLGLAALVVMAAAVVLVTILLVSNAARQDAPAPAPEPRLGVTALATFTPLAEPAAEQTATPTSEPTALAPSVATTVQPTPPPTPTPRVTSYTVVERDTLWDIATRFGLSVDELIGANPQINPNVIRPGAMLKIPAPGEIDVSKVVKPTSAPAGKAQPVKARVSATSGGLRLRRTPSTSGRIIARLPALTSLTVLDGSANSVWLLVQLSDGRRGWVMSRYVDMNVGGAVAPEQALAERPRLFL